MAREPDVKRTIAFADGQNLYHAARLAFGHSQPDYDISSLARVICDERGWTLNGIRFYTGVPEASGDPESTEWHRFWARKLSKMGRQGVTIIRKPIVAENEWIITQGGNKIKGQVKRERGTDVSIATGVIAGAALDDYDVALIFSQNQSLDIVADAIVDIAEEQDRWIKLASAFPMAEGENSKGIDGTEWIPIDRRLYNECLDKSVRNSRYERAHEAALQQYEFFQAFGRIECMIKDAVLSLRKQRGASTGKKFIKDLEYMLKVELKVLLWPMTDSESRVVEKLCDIKVLRNRLVHENIIIEAQHVQRTKILENDVRAMLGGRQLL